MSRLVSKLITPRSTSRNWAVIEEPNGSLSLYNRVSMKSMTVSPECTVKECQRIFSEEKTRVRQNPMFITWPSNTPEVFFLEKEQFVG